MNYTFHISRSAGATAPASFRVALEERMTVLDGLFQIQREMDPTISFRCSCRVGMCGTCAVLVNRVPRLACGTMVKNLNSEVVRVEPLPNLPRLKDLVVSLEPFFDQWKQILPGLHTSQPDSQELVRVPADSKLAKQSAGKRDCITCGICFAACGIPGTSSRYLGPAAINKAFLRVLDPRDEQAKTRLQVLSDEQAGIWRCHTQYNCTVACPRGISLTDSIGRIKRGMIWPTKLLSH